MTRAINPSHARQEREQRAERHRTRQLLKTEAGARQWVREAQRELDLWLAGLPQDAIDCARHEATQRGTEIQRLVQDAMDRRSTPSELAASVWSVVVERVKASQATQSPCSTCNHRCNAHSRVVVAWCYACNRECKYTAPAHAHAAVSVPDFALW